MQRHIPNILTVLRIVLALFGATALWLSFAWSQGVQTVPAMLGEPRAVAQGFAFAGLLAFLIAAASDWLDGYLARRWSAQSAFGSVLDPIADKILVNAYLVVYTMILNAPLELAVPVAAIVLRDAVITLARMVGKDRPEETLPVSPSAKLKTGFALIVTAFPLIAVPAGWHTSDIALTIWIGAVWLTAALSLATGLAYLKPPARKA